MADTEEQQIVPGLAEAVAEPEENTPTAPDAQDEDAEMDDLFGDDPEEDEEGAETRAAQGIDVDDNDQDDEEEEEEEEREGEGEEEQPQEEIKELDVTLERHPRSHTPENAKSYSFPLPRFLFVDPEPFTPNVFESKVKQFIDNTTASDDYDDQSVKSSIEFRKLQLLNTIRWRYAKHKSNGLYKQSNAKIIEWDDGTMSLRLGNEMFDIRTKNNDDNILAFQNRDTLMALLTLDKSIQVLPPSMKSRAHKILANTLTKNMKQKRSKTINTIVTHEDPELKAREVSRVQREIEKARRRQIQKLQQEEEAASSGSASRSGSHMSSSLAAAGAGIDVEDGDGYYGDDYDDEDEDDDDYGNGNSRGGNGFVVDDDDDVSAADDDELDKAAERLKQVKRAGAAKYAADDNGNGNDEDDDDEGAVVRKKRRVVLDEDDDE
jgi:RNA polymerase-associated protein LEO1